MSHRCAGCREQASTARKPALTVWPVNSRKFHMSSPRPSQRPSGTHATSSTNETAAARKILRRSVVARCNRHVARPAPGRRRHAGGFPRRQTRSRCGPTRPRGPRGHRRATRGMTVIPNWGTSGAGSVDHNVTIARVATVSPVSRLLAQQRVRSCARWASNSGVDHACGSMTTRGGCSWSSSSLWGSKTQSSPL
jgi:hypothetical protein